MFANSQEQYLESLRQSGRGYVAAGAYARDFPRVIPPPDVSPHSKFIVISL